MSATRRIYLYGGLAEKFGSEAIELTAGSAPDLMLALKSIFPEWRAHLRDYPQLVFIVSGDDKSDPRGIEAEFITSQFGDATEVHVIPAQEGAGIEVAVAVFGMTAGTFGAIAVNIVASMLLSIALGAIFQMLAPSPSTSAGSSNQVAQNQSFLYNGAVNTQQQGGPVPLIYGYFMSGSTVISAAVDVEQLMVTPAFSAPPENGGGAAQPAAPAAVTWQWTGA